MVHCHALREQVIHARPTQDADGLAEIHSTSYTEVAKAVRQLGFEVREPLDHRAPVHRFERPDGAVVDLMAPDRQTSPPRYLGRPVIPVPGSDSALNGPLSMTFATASRYGSRTLNPLWSSRVWPISCLARTENALTRMPSPCWFVWTAKSSWRAGQCADP